MAPHSRLLAALCGLLAMSTTALAYYTGDGTAYSGDYEKDATGKNACGFGDVGDYFEKYYAARPTSGWDSSDCGRCIRVRGLNSGASGNWVKVMILDQCQGCKGGDVDLSTRALKESTGFSWDRKPIEWEYIDCSADASTSSESKEKKSKKKKKKSSKKSSSDSSSDGSSDGSNGVTISKDGSSISVNGTDIAVNGTTFSVEGTTLEGSGFLITSSGVAVTVNGTDVNVNGVLISTANGTITDTTASSDSGSSRKKKSSSKRRKGRKHRGLRLLWA